MLLEIPLSQTIYLKNRLAMLVISSILWQDIKCDILENLCTTIKIESLLLFYIGKPKTKSIDTLTKGSWGTSKGVYKL